MKSRREWIWPGVGLLCATGMPALYALLNDAWICSGFGFADAHVNVSLGRRFFEHAYRLEPYLLYKTSRVPLLLVQAAARQTLSSTLAQAVLALTPVVAIGWLLWRITARALGRTTAALVTSLALGSSYLYVLRYSGGTDYMNLIGAALALFAVERFTVALERGRDRSWLAFGAAFAAALYTNPLSAFVIGILCPVELVATCRRLAGASVARAGLGAVLGLAATTAGLAAACALGGKEAFFLGPQLAQLVEAWRRRDQELPDPVGLGELLARPGYEHLGIAAAVLAVAVALLVRRLLRGARTRDWRGQILDRSVLWCAQFVIVGAFFVWQELRGGILLDVVHHSHPLLVSMWLAVGGIHRMRGVAAEAPRLALTAWTAVAGGATLGLIWPLATSRAPLGGAVLSAGVVLVALTAGALVPRRLDGAALLLVALGCGWPSAAAGELSRYDPYGLNEAIHQADVQLWELLRAAGPAVVDHPYSYAGTGLVDVALSPEHHGRRAAIAHLVDRLRGRDPGAVDPPLSTAMSAARFANALHYSIGMLFLDRVGVRNDPAPYPPAPSTFVFYTPPGRLLVDSPFQRERFAREHDVSVVVFGVTDAELRELLAVLAARGRPMTVRRPIELRTRPFTLRGYLLVSEAGV